MHQVPIGFPKVPKRVDGMILKGSGIEQWVASWSER